jgi:hypothetical protein
VVGSTPEEVVVESQHPYLPPASEVGGPSSGISGGGPGGITPGIVDALRKTRPWVLFMGIMILLGCGLMVLGGIAMMAIGGLFGEAAPFSGLALGLVYLVMAALYLYPAIRLLRYASAIRTIDGPNQAGAIEDALVHQQAFWRFVGLVTVAILALYAVIIVGAIIFGIATGFGG